MAKDFYKILGVDRAADEKEIKRAYRKLARQHHPDINPNDKGAEARFKEINEAFQVLSDKEKRPLYDQLGDDYDKVPAGMSAEDFARYSRGGGGFGGGNAGGHSSGGANLEDLFEQVRRQGGSGGFNVQGGGAEVFENLFGGRGASNQRGGFGFGGNRSRASQKGGDVEQPVEISLAESIRGTQRSLRLTIQSEAGDEARNVTVKIPAGVRDGARVRVANQGASGLNGGGNGDLFLRVHLEPHPFWKREGDDLTCEVPVSFGEAALGATIAVPTTESEVNLKIPMGTQSGQTFRLSGRGVKQKDGKSGDIFVRVKIAVPKNLSERERELIEELSNLQSENVRRDLPKSL